MAKILNLNDLLEAAAVLPESERQKLVELAQATVSVIAHRIADVLDVVCIDVSYQGSALGGLCASFSMKYDLQECPAELHDGDPAGDWE
jgi:hypothetical protein